MRRGACKREQICPSKPAWMMQVWEHAAEQAEFLVSSRESDDFDAEDCYRQAAHEPKQLLLVCHLMGLASVCANCNYASQRLPMQFLARALAVLFTVHIVVWTQSQSTWSVVLTVGNCCLQSHARLHCLDGICAAPDRHLLVAAYSEVRPCMLQELWRAMLYEAYSVRATA